MQTLVLKGSRFAVGGRLAQGRVRALERALEEAGGVLVGPSATVMEIFVAGQGAGQRAADAKLRGAAIISEAQARLLLAHGTIALEAAREGGEATLDASVAELRGIFGQAPSSEGWTRCLEIIEACDAQRVEDLVAYAAPFVASWDGKQMGKWAAPSLRHPLMADASSRWLKGLVEGELRVAPASWALAMMRGDYHAKHGLVRAINLEGLKINGAMGLALLQSPHLTGVRALALGSQNRLPLSFYKALRTSALMRTVRELWLCTLGHEWREGLAGEDHSFEALERVHAHQGHTGELEALPCFQGMARGESVYWLVR